MLPRLVNELEVPLVVVVPVVVVGVD